MTKKKNPLSGWLAEGDNKKFAVRLLAIVVSAWFLIGTHTYVRALADEVAALRREVKVFREVKKEIRKVSQGLDDVFEVIERVTRVRPRSR